MPEKVASRINGFRLFRLEVSRLCGLRIKRVLGAKTQQRGRRVKLLHGNVGCECAISSPRGRTSGSAQRPKTCSLVPALWLDLCCGFDRQQPLVLFGSGSVSLTGYLAKLPTYAKPPGCQVPLHCKQQSKTTKQNKNKLLKGLKVRC